ncbi:MAG TPA: hypothetical protein VG759_28990 [Candidatus Angelobacter sp.]|nr:hypothetical protein [Candidatus Angelobacter sp.]
MNLDRATSGRFLSRRQVLGLLPAASVPLLVPKVASAGVTCSQPLISLADSVFYYRIFLERVRSDAISFVGHYPAELARECSGILEMLKSTLSDLRDKLKRANGSPSVSKLETHLGTLEQNVALMPGHTMDMSDPVRLSNIPITNGVLIEIARDAAKDCDLDPKGEIRTLLDKIFGMFDKNNGELKLYREALDKFTQETTAVNEVITRNEQSLEKTGVLLGLVFNEGGVNFSPQLPDVVKSRDLLRDIVDDLKGLPVLPGTKNKDTLISLLEATEDTLGNPAKLQSAAYHLEAGSDRRNMDPLGPYDQSSLMDRVRTVVMKPGYFRWRTFVQVVNCIAVCTPIWVSYSGERNKDLRKRLISEALDTLVWGVLNIEAAATDLKDIFYSQVV